MGNSTSFKEKWFERGDTEALRRWLSKGVDMNGFDYDGFSVMHYACYHHQAPMLALLLENGCDVNLRTTKAYEPYGDILPDISDKGCTPLHVAASRGSLDCVELLLEWGADPTIINSRRRTALKMAFDEEIKELLVEGIRVVREKRRRQERRKRRKRRTTTQSRSHGQMEEPEHGTLSARRVGEKDESTRKHKKKHHKKHKKKKKKKKKKKHSQEGSENESVGGESSADDAASVSDASVSDASMISYTSASSFMSDSSYVQETVPVNKKVQLVSRRARSESREVSISESSQAGSDSMRGAPPPYGEVDPKRIEKKKKQHRVLPCPRCGENLTKEQYIVHRGPCKAEYRRTRSREVSLTIMSDYSATDLEM